MVFIFAVLLVCLFELLNVVCCDEIFLLLVVIIYFVCLLFWIVFSVCCVADGEKNSKSRIL